MYMEAIVAEYEKLDRVRQPTGSILPGIAPSNVYPTADDQWLVIGANQDNVFARLAAVLGESGWIAEGSPYLTHEGRGARQAELDGLVAAATLRYRADELLALLERAGVPAGLIYTAADIARDPHFAARQMVVRAPEPALHGETVAMPGVVPKLSSTPGHIERGGPLLGEHNEEIWSKVIGQAALDELQTAGVI